MHHAIIFPEGRRGLDENVALSIEVHTTSDDNTLQRASDSRRLRCPGCLGRLIVERSPAVHGPVSHFRHFRGTDPDCPFRVNWEWPADERLPPVSRRGEDPGMMIERLLLRALQRSLADRPGVEVRPVAGRLPKMEIDGFTEPVEILSLAPGDEARWSQPFSGARDDRQTLFFVAGWDLHRLDEAVFRRTLLPVRPWIVIWPARPGSPGDRFAFVSWIPDAGSEMLPIAELDLAWIDYRALFRGRPSEGDALFIRRPHRLAIERLEGALRAEEPGDAELWILWRLVAKILLVEGAGAHRALFQESRTRALEPYLASAVFPTAEDLLGTMELFDLQKLDESAPAKEDPLIHETAREILTGYLPGLRKRLRSVALALRESRDREQERQQELEKAKKETEEYKNRLSVSSSVIADLEGKLGDEEVRSTGLEARASRLEEVEAEKERLEGALSDRGELEKRVRGLAGENDELEKLLGALRIENEMLSAQEEELREWLRKVWRHQVGRLVLEHYLEGRELRARLQF